MRFQHGCADGSRVVSSRAAVAISWVGIWLLTLSAAYGFQAPTQAPLVDLDQRLQALPKPAFPTPQQQQAIVQLRNNVPGVQVTVDPLRDSPRFISRSSGFLSKSVGGVGLAQLAPDSNAAVTAFLNQYSGVFGYDGTILGTTVITRDSVTAHNGLHTVVREQQVDAIPVFDSRLISHVTQQGELVNLFSLLLANPAAAADAGTPNRQAVEVTPPVTAAQAVANAAQNLGNALIAAQVEAADAPAGATRQQRFTAPALRGAALAQLIWLPMNGSTLRLCWDVMLTGQARPETYRVLIDAQTGAVVVRRCLTEYISAATFNVYTSDSPSPFSPGCPVPCTTQPSLVSRTLVTLSAIDTTASPNGWIDDGNNTTTGNNVDAYLDKDANDTPDPGSRPIGSPFRVFNFPLDLTKEPVTYTNATVVQLFYLCNFMHDKLYQLGFDEASGNFQTSNFGRGGLGGDALQAEAQDGSGTDNANMTTFPDGIPPRMQMYLFTGPTPGRDGSLDAEVVLHEYTHGLSNRLVGGGGGIFELQTEGMGEGWSDFYALSLLGETGDNPNAVYPEGGYVTFDLGGTGFDQNYYFGIRRYPYSTDLAKNPLTFKDIDPDQASSHAGVPHSPVIGDTADEVHNMGEVWCVTLWECRAKLITRYGFAVGNQLMLQLVTDAMKLSPANPNFLEARDAILQADQIDNGGVNLFELWSGFAKRGMGVSASSPASSTTTGLVEAFDVPSGLVVVDVVVTGGNGNGIVDANECNNLGVILSNTAPFNADGPFSAQLGSVDFGVNVIQSTGTYPTIPPNGVATNNLDPFVIATSPAFPCGTTINLVLTIKTATGITTNFVPLSTVAPSLGVPIRVDNGVARAIPDLQTVNSSNLVSGALGPVGKVTASMFVRHSFDADLTISLISPKGTEVLLTSGNGGGANNYGTNCVPDSSRTTFDDAAITPIANGVAAFVGSFQPQGLLSDFNGENANGVWQLRIADTQPLDAGTLNCWSLFVTPTTCAAGNGLCAAVPILCSGVSQLDFGTLIIGNSTTASLALTNCGSAELVISNVTVTGSGAASYTLVSNPCQGAHLAPNGTCSIDVQFSPLFANNPANLVITDNAGGPHEVVLAGAGVTCSAMTIEPTGLPMASPGVPYNQSLSVAGGTPPLAFIRTAGDLPDGMALTTSGSVTGTPTVVGEYPFRVVVIDANGCTGARYYNGSLGSGLTVTCGTIVVSPSVMPLGQIGLPYSATFSANGGAAPYTFAVTSGSLPDGLGLIATSGSLTGTPKVIASAFDITATDVFGCPGRRSYTMVLAIPPPNVPGGVLPPAVAGLAVQQSIVASGGQPPYQYAISGGTLPAGLQMSGTGQITGVPTAAGKFIFTVSVTDNDGRANSAQYWMKVKPAVLRADAMIQLQGLNALLGNGVYSGAGEGETVTATAAPGVLLRFFITIQNGGNVSDLFRVQGVGDSAFFTVRYFLGKNGTTDITAAVTSGAYTTEVLAPGAQTAKASWIRMEIQAATDAPSGSVRKAPVTVRSVADSSVADTVKARVTVP